MSNHIYIPSTDNHEHCHLHICGSSLCRFLLGALWLSSVVLVAQSTREKTDEKTDSTARG